MSENERWRTETKRLKLEWAGMSGERENELRPTKAIWPRRMIEISKKPFLPCQPNRGEREVRGKKFPNLMNIFRR